MPCGVSHCIPPISENFVRTSLQQLSTGKASTLDELCTYFLKVAASYISLSSTAILNLSISSGLFPNIRENSKVSPLLVHCLTDLIIAPYQFRLLHQTFLSVTYNEPFIIVFANMSCFCNLVSIVITCVSCLWLTFLITF